MFQDEPIAIIGIGCRFPGADGPGEFWTLLREGRDAIREVPAERREIAAFDPDARGGFLERVDGFDADFFGLSPREAVPLDPQQRLLLEVSWEALEDAGQAPERLEGSATGVFIGIATNDYGRMGGGDDREGELYRITGNALSIAANRLSYLFDFRGPSLAIDTACSSSLVAVHLACQSLRNGESTLALAGGVNLILSPAIADSFRQAGMLAPDGRCKTFDARADGYVRSEGAGVVILKPLTRALADGDSIYAVIRGSAVNQDGRSNGLTAPSRQSQEAVLRAACRQAGIAPGQIGYVEAHGTGTYLGDPIEAKALGTVLAVGRPAGERCLVGSVKTNFGHLEAAAGIAGLIKTALALKHRAVPANLHFHEPNPQIAIAELPLDVPRTLVPWPGPEEAAAFAGVSSFGFGGTNAHVVLEGIAETDPELRPGYEPGVAASFLLLISARRAEALKALALAYRDALVNDLPGADLGSIAYSAAARRGHHDFRLALVGCCRADWVAQLDAFLRGEPHAGLRTGRAFGGRHPDLTALPEGYSFARGRNGVVIPSLGPGDEGRTERLESVAVLYTQGGSIAWDQLEPPARFVRLPSYPWQRERFWWESVVRCPAPESRPDAEHTRNGKLTPGIILEELHSAPVDERSARLVPYMQARLGAVLRVEPDAIDLQRPLDAVGIDSLMAMELKLDVEKDLGIVLPLTSLLLGPTLTELTAEIAELIGDRAVDSEPADAPGPAAEEAVFASAFAFADHPLSYGQQSLWSLHQLAPESAAYHMAGAARVSLAIDVELLLRCLQTLGDRHAALRTTFPAQDGKPVQRVHDAETVMVDFGAEDASDLSESEMARRLVAVARRPFDLERGPLFRARLFVRSKDDQVLLLVFHHIVGDFWSIAVLLEELGRLYPAVRSGGRVDLSPLALQATDYARRQAALLAGVEGERLWRYWEKRLAGPLPVLNFPTDRPRPAVQTDRGASRSLALDHHLTERLVALSGAHGASLYTTLLTAFQVLLHRYTAQDDVIVGSPVAGRNQPGFSGVVGYFVNTLPMRGDLSGNPTFASLLDRVRTTVHEALEHQDFPYPLMVERLTLPRDPSRSPVFQVLFVFQKAQGRTTRELSSLTLQEPGPRIELGGLPLELLPLDIGVAQFDMTLVAAEQNQRLAVSLDYNADLFGAATIERFLAQFRTLLGAIVARPEQPIDALDILPGSERRQLLSDWNTTRSEGPGAETITQLFAIQVNRSPDAPAVAFGDRELTYAELNARANRLAHHLRGLGIGALARIGLCAERSLELIVGILGILKAGGAYVPLDPEYPEERLEFLIADARIDLVLTQDSLRSRFVDRVAHVVGLDAGAGIEVIDGECDDDPAQHGGGEDLAYVIYTSGSTGTPKGVMVSHRNLVHSTHARRVFYDEPMSGFLLLSSFAFDSSVAGIFGTLCHGGTLVLPPPGVQNDPFRLADQIGDRRVSHLLCVPSLYELLLAEAPLERLRGLRVAIVAGEPCRGTLVARHRAALPKTALVNEYGPTEATVWCAAHRCIGDELRAGGEPRALVPIGRPIANTRIYVLDAHSEPVPIGVAGELHVGGPGVARGYLDRPRLTAERFLPDPFGDDSGGRLYRTGDLARWLPGGTLEFLGRIDDQVKVRGYRIELGEVESVLVQHPAVREAVVVAREDIPGTGRLVAYLVTESDRDSDTDSHIDWRHWVRGRLPEYMVPAAFVLLDRLPLSPNGKIDRKALPVSEPGHLAARSEYVAPRDPVEDRLARIAAEVLHCDRVGVHDNFFDLGVDSILSIQIASRARQAGLELSPGLLFQYPTIAELAARTDRASPSLADQGPVSGPLPLTPIQREFFAKDLPEPHHYSQSLLLETRPAPDADRMAQAVKALIAHHDALRLRFTPTATGWSQAGAAEEVPVPFSRFDLSALAETDQSLAIEALAAGFRRSLDLTAGPLVRVALFDLGPDRPARLLLVIHQLAVDTVSWRILLEDLETLDRQLARGVPPELPPKTTSFRSWAEHLEQSARATTLEDEEAYWLAEEFRPVVPLPLDFGHDRDPGSLDESATVTITLDEDETRTLLEEVPLAFNTRVEDALLTALTEALAEWTGHEAVRLDLEGQGRDRALDFSRTVGWFTTRFPVTLERPADSRPSAALKSIKEQLRRIPRHGIGYGLLRYPPRETPLAQRLARLPSAEVGFRYGGEIDRILPASSAFALAGGEALGPVQGRSARRCHLLEIDAGLVRGELRLRWTYSAVKHRPGSIENLAEEFREALRALIADCQSPETCGYTPSDFPLAGLDQRTLDQLVLMVEGDDEEGFET